MVNSHIVRSVRGDVRDLGQSVPFMEVIKVMPARVATLGWFLTIAALGSWVGVMSQDNVPPYEYDAAASFVLPDPAPQGSVVTVNWALSKFNRTCPGMLQRNFRDLTPGSPFYGQVVATLDTVYMSRAVRSTDKRIPRSFELPPELPPVVGYSVDVCAECNLLQRISPLCFKTPEIKFNVKPREVPAK